MKCFSVLTLLYFLTKQCYYGQRLYYNYRAFESNLVDLLKFDVLTRIAVKKEQEDAEKQRREKKKKDKAYVD